MKLFQFNSAITGNPNNWAMARVTWFEEVGPTRNEIYIFPRTNRREQFVKRPMVLHLKIFLKGKTIDDNKLLKAYGATSQYIFKIKLES